ncbi:type III-B CRISPR-associated protein Cas10/Cmr2 [Suttonella indologenes]|uniref:CRISPR-associated protein Cas10/Cmr2, subtype III-B n=1 Tax=Suttonella indologenes TaxID=13276 RepID=A0A380MIQ4_9GAMM|nr:type III-B CRISPR-associated protein Cas10/Cmr2 [Suttonella indologenes]SUO91285.1 CRISPR-associated protein Cas10/Cmr2, subtype III-B [Suttonella indologenes]
MNSYVLILSVGPVQGFIASARRSRDLWAGSWLLSEIAKAAAQSLLNSGAEMIFPHAEENKLPENVGNKIQVIIKNKSQEELLNIAKEAKKAAEDFFVKQADDVFEKIGKQLRQELWDNQKTIMWKCNTRGQKWLMRKNMFQPAKKPPPCWQRVKPLVILLHHLIK